MSTAYYAAIKWPMNATKDEIDKILQDDLHTLVETLIEAYGFSVDRVLDLLEGAIDTAENLIDEEQ